MPGLLPLTAADPALLELLHHRLQEVNRIFDRQLASEMSAVNTLCLHVENYRGKMLRPTLVLLSGLAAGTPAGDARVLNDRHLTVAAVVEMIHMATLVHDDVLDESDVRRRGATVNHLWGNETAVILGDYLISNAFHLCSSLGDSSINHALGGVTNTVCEGELVQLHHRNDYSLDEATYFEIIQRKTASLIGECCRLGALFSQAPLHVAAALREFGSAIGVAFQIQDDLLDLIGSPGVVGKSLGRDLAKGKLTLPLISYLAEADAASRGEALAFIQSQETERLRARLVDSGAVDRAARHAAALVADARERLTPLAPSAALDLLHALAEQVVTRTA